MPQASPIIAWLIAYRYVIIFPIALIEGPVAMMIGGFLVRTGVFAFWPAYFLFVAGDLCGDVGWYWVGRRAARPLIKRFGHLLSITEEKFEKAESLFHDHQTKILFISKLTTGFGFAVGTLLAAGAAKVSFRKFFIINLLGEFVWAAILMGIGFFFGNLYGLVGKSLRWAFVIGLIVVGFAIMYGFGKAMKKRFN